MNSRAVWVTLFLAGALLAGCTSTGTATGQLVSPSGKREAVKFNWRSDAGDWHHGKISVALPNGEHYSGTYRQVSQVVPVDAYASMWVGWRPFWPDWPTPWYRGTVAPDWRGWTRVYEGRVVARLESGNPDRAMRCRFELDDPTNGLSGGGHGECRLSDGSSIEGAEIFPKEDSD